MGLCSPGTYNYTYSVTNSNGISAAPLVRQLIMYNSSYFTLPEVVVFPSISDAQLALLTRDTLNSGNTSTANYTAATKVVAKKLTLLGVQDSDVDIFNAAMLTFNISKTLLSYNISVTATVWWYYPPLVHRALLQAFNTAVSARGMHSWPSASSGSVRSKAAFGRRTRPSGRGLIDLGAAFTLEDLMGASSWDDDLVQEEDHIAQSQRLLPQEASGNPWMNGDAPEGGSRRRLMDTSSSKKTALGASKVTLTTTSPPVNATANTYASIFGLMKILLNQTSAAKAKMFGKVASGISTSVAQFMYLERVRGNKTSTKYKKFVSYVLSAQQNITAQNKVVLDLLTKTLAVSPVIPCHPMSSHAIPCHPISVIHLTPRLDEHTSECNEPSIVRPPDR